MGDFTLLKTALEQEDKEHFKLIAKGDLHNHGLLGSNRKIFGNFFNDRTLDKFYENDKIESLSKFIKNNIIDISTTKQGQLKLFECTILTAIEDGVSKLDMSVDYRLVFEVYNNKIDDYINDLLLLKNKYNKSIKLNFDLGISRNAYKKEHFDIIVKLIETNIFNGIDLFGDESAKPLQIFKKIYRIAEKHNMLLKAHVGEFGTAKDIYIAIKILHLNVIQHGISIIEDEKIMKFAKNNNIQFNVCPISNLKLKRVNKITEHPIKKMFDFGLKITINTDDQLIFENSLFDEYLLLYKNKIFSISELNKIRLNALEKD